MPKQVKTYKRSRKRSKPQLELDVYSGTLSQLLNDQDALDRLSFWDDNDVVETKSGGFTVRYVWKRLYEKEAGIWLG